MFGTETPFIILGAILVVGTLIGWTTMFKFLGWRKDKRDSKS